MAAINTLLTFTFTGGVWVLDTGQPDYDIKRELMVPMGNAGRSLLPGADELRVTDLYKQWYPNIALKFGAAAVDHATFTFGDPIIVAVAAGVLTLDFTVAQKCRVVLDQDVTSVVVVDPMGAGNFMIEFVQDATGGWDVGGWPAPPRVRWPGGSVPVFGDVALAERLVSMYFNGPTIATYKGEFNASTYS